MSSEPLCASRGVREAGEVGVLEITRVVDQWKNGQVSLTRRPVMPNRHDA